MMFRVQCKIRAFHLAYQWKYNFYLLVILATSSQVQRASGLFFFG